MYLCIPGIISTIWGVCLFSVLYVGVLVSYVYQTRTLPGGELAGLADPDQCIRFGYFCISDGHAYGKASFFRTKSEKDDRRLCLVE